MRLFDPVTVEFQPGDPPRSVFATIDTFEPEMPDIEADWLLRLDVVDETSWNAVTCGFDNTSPDEIRRALRTFILETESSQTRQILGPLLQYLRRPMEGDRRWWRFELEARTTRPQVQVFSNVFADPFRLKLSRVDDVDIETQLKLNATCGMDHLPDATKGELEAVLKSFAMNVSYIGVLDVGQGSANVLLDEDRTPLAYFDFGGAVLTNRRTWPEDLTGLCMTQKPVVILSHWDLDHWAAHKRCRPFQAGDVDPAYANQVWIVPRNPPNDKPSHSHVKFLDVLQRSGARVLIWPNDLESISVGRIRIVKCTGQTRNDSGLALIVSYRKGKGLALLSGDANLNCVPHTEANLQNVRTLVVPHHGARLEGDPLERGFPCIAPTIVVSFGARNTYGHPDYRSIRSWRCFDWYATAERKKTKFGQVGSVLIDLDGDRLGIFHSFLRSRVKPKTLTAPCRGKVCNLVFKMTI